MTNPSQRIKSCVFSASTKYLLDKLFFCACVDKGTLQPTIIFESFRLEAFIYSELCE